MPVINKESTGELTAVLSIEVKPPDYKVRLDKIVKDYGKKIELKGFRKGMVPGPVIRKMFGNQILAEELGKIVEEEMDRYISDNKLQILGQPLPVPDVTVKPEISAEKDYRFAFELGIAPEVSVNDLSSFSFTRHKIVPAQKDIDEEVVRMQKRFGKITNPEDISPADTLYVEFRESANGAVENKATILMEHVSDKPLHDRLLAAKKGDFFELDVYSAFTRDREQVNRHYLGLEEGREPASSLFNMQILNINRVEPLPVGQELFDKVYGEGQVNSAEEFRERIGSGLGSFLERQSDKRLEEEIMNTLLEKTPLTLPDDFLKKWMRETADKELPEEQIESEYGIFARELRWSLIFNHLAVTLAVEVKPEEIIERTNETIVSQFRLYGFSDVDQERIDNISRGMLRDQEHIRRTRDELVHRKVFTRIVEMATIKQKETSLEEFNNTITKR